METKQANLKRIFGACLAVYVVLTVAFCFLAGEQLHLRNSRGNLTMPVADMGAAELVQGVTVEQNFVVNIQRLESVSVQWGTYYRTNTGTVTMELYNLATGTVLLAQTFDATAIAESQILTMTAEVPIEAVCGVPLLLRLCADSLPGSAVAPLMASTVQNDGQTLRVNGTAVAGTLCFSAVGTDYIWAGLHYWEFVAVFGVVLVLAFLSVLWRVKNGKRSYVTNAIAAVQKYRFLIRQLVSRDFKLKYKRSVLGIFWSFLNPLLLLCVQYIVFSTVFERGVENFAVYLLIGVVCFNFFSESCSMTLTSVLGNASLITKVYIPKYIYPLTRVISSVVNFAISLIPLLLVCIFTGVRFRKAALLSFFFFFCLILFSLGLGLLLSASMVFFRDTQFLWNVCTMMWMYATPIFYPESILPEQFKFVLAINPLAHFLKNVRLCIMSGISPEPFAYVQCLAIAGVMLLVGSFVFKKTQDKFLLYL